MVIKSNAVKGFTLMELMIALSVLAIITTLAVPAMTGFFDKRRVIEAAEDMYSSIQLARVEAISRSALTFVHFGTISGSWVYGVSINRDCDLTKTDPTEDNADACLMVIDDGDGVIDDGTATIDDGDVVLYRYAASDYTNVSMTINQSPNTDNQIVFDPHRGIIKELDSGVSAVVITLQSELGRQMRLMIGMLGGVRLCSPSGSGHVAGYSSDGCS